MKIDDEVGLDKPDMPVDAKDADNKNGADHKIEQKGKKHAYTFVFCVFQQVRTSYADDLLSEMLPEKRRQLPLRTDAANDCYNLMVAVFKHLIQCN